MTQDEDFETLENITPRAYRDIVARIRSTIESRDAEIERLKGELGEKMDLAATHYGEVIRSLMAERDTLQRENTRLETQAQMFQARNAVVEHTLRALQQERDEARHENARNVEARIKARNERDSLRHQVERLREALEVCSRVEAYDPEDVPFAVDVARQALIGNREGR
jgi:NurA-like 5'-3' nuclease